MSLSFSLRPATEDDLPKILAIEQQSSLSPWTEKSFRSELTQSYSQFLLMTDDETDSLVAGYLILWLLLQECQILNLVVSQPYRGLGLAKRMLEKTIQIALQKGMTQIFLDVRKSNPAAIQLYQSFHFTIVHIRKNFYSDGEDAYTMALPLI